MKPRQLVENLGLSGRAEQYHTLGTAYYMLNKFWLVADNDDHGFTPHAKNDGYWEAWITAWMTRELPGKAFIDVGANMGYYGLLACSMGCPTYFFEPQPKLYDLIRASVQLNNFQANISATAAGAETSVETFTVPKHHGMLATYAYDVRSPDYENAAYTHYPVQVEPLDRLVGWQDGMPLLVKLDVEGAEPQAWAGMQQLFRRKYPTTVILEFRADRYKNPVGFATELLAAGRVSYVNEDSYEVPVVSHEALTSRPDHDWMVVVRPGQDTEREVLKGMLP